MAHSALDDKPSALVTVSDKERPRRETTTSPVAECNCTASRTGERSTYATVVPRTVLIRTALSRGKVDLSDRYTAPCSDTASLPIAKGVGG